MTQDNLSSNNSTRLTPASARLAKYASIPILAALLLAGSQRAGAQVTYALTNVWYVPTNAASANNIITTSDQNRSLDYDAVSNQVFVVAKAGTAPQPGIEVLDAATGSFLGLLDKTVVAGGTFLLNQVKVARDGAIYAANLVSPGSATSITKIYRWANWQSPATVAWAGNALSNPATGFMVPATPGQRVGDTMDITGSGASTLIVMTIATASPTLSTNMILFTTTDGINFSNHIIAVSGFTAGGSGICGVSFYTNNTLLVRTSGSAGNNVALIQFPANIASLDAGPIAAAQIGSYALPGVLSTTAFIDYAAAGQGGLLAVASPQNAGGVSASGQVALYADPVVGNGICSLQLASTNYPHLTSNGNLAGAVALGGSGFAQYIFSLDCNNGVRCSAITTIPAQPPAITTQPAGGTFYPPYTLSVSASGFCPLTYQWQATNYVNGFTNIPGATGSSYIIASASTNYYRVMITNSVNPAATSSVALVTALSPATNSAVSQLWRVAAGTSGYSYLSPSDNNTRGLGYDTNSHRVVVASTSSLNILNGDNGTNIGAMSLTGVTFGGLLGGCDQVGIADDGVVYAGNLVIGSGFALYRWGAPTTTNTAIPVLGDSSPMNTGDRWGDTLSVRGAGPLTQILLGSRSGTNVALLTTADGTNFLASVIAITNAPGGFAANGITFGAGNTLWAKSVPGRLYEIAFDPTGFTGGALLEYPNPSAIPTYMAGVGVDPVRNILAGVDLGDVPHDLKLSQLTGTTEAPVLFSQSFFASANGNGNANVVIAMKYPRVYALDVNNGLLALTYGVPATTPLNITVPPASQTVYTNDAAVTLSAGVSGSVPMYYQWRYYGASATNPPVNIPGATNSTYVITYPAVSASGYYDLVIHNISGYATSTPPTLLTVITPTVSPVVTQLWTLAAGSRPYLDGSSYATRGLAYDPSETPNGTATLLVADHANIYLLSATNGAELGQLNMTGLGTAGYNGWVVDQMGVADDGVLYSCNLTLSGPGFYIVRWPSITPGAFADSYAWGPADGTGADPSGTGDRWGDTLTVRGSGTSTEILCASYSGTRVVLFTTADGVTFTANVINVTNAPAGFAGQGITFGPANTFWAKSPGYNLRHVSYDTTTGIGTVVELFTAGTQVDSTMDAISVDVANNILAGVVFSDTPNDLQLLQLSGNANPPALFNQAFFGSANLNSQLNGVTTIKAGHAFGLNVNNGLVALSYGVPAAPAVTLTGVTNEVGTGVTLTWNNCFNGRNYQVLYKNALTNGSWTPLGAPVTAVGPTATFTDTSALVEARYYRVQSQ